MPLIQADTLNKTNNIFWAGSLFVYNEEWDNNNTFEYADRRKIVNDFNNKYPNILHIKRVPYHLFHESISKYKFYV